MISPPGQGGGAGDVEETEARYESARQFSEAIKVAFQADHAHEAGAQRKAAEAAEHAHRAAEEGPGGGVAKG